MRSISHEQNFAYSKAGCASLLKLVGTHAHQLVLMRLRGPRENLFVAEGLAFDQFFTRQILGITIGDPP